MGVTPAMGGRRRRYNHGKDKESCLWMYLCRNCGGVYGGGFPGLVCYPRVRSVHRSSKDDSSSTSSVATYYSARRAVPYLIRTVRASQDFGGRTLPTGDTGIHLALRHWLLITATSFFLIIAGGRVTLTFTLRQTKFLCINFTYLNVIYFLPLDVNSLLCTFHKFF